MGNMVTFYEEDYCMDCNTAHALSIYDIFNNKTPLSSILKDSGSLSRRQMSYIRCDKCGKEYNIDWSAESRVPKPLLTNIELNQFLQDFKQNSNYILYK